MRRKSSNYATYWTKPREANHESQTPRNARSCAATHLWIGLVCAVLLYVALRTIKADSVRLRYGLGIRALLSVLLAGMFAWEWSEMEQKTEPAQVDSADDYHLSAVSEISATEEHTEHSMAESTAVRVVPARHTVPRATEKPASRKQVDWRRSVGVCWMIGVLISLLRLFRISWDTQRLVRQCHIVESEAVQRVMTEVSKAAGFSRRILMPPGTPLMVRAKSMAGYTIHQMIDPVSTNYAADCHLEPAGGIAISCFFPDGTEAAQYGVYTETRSIVEPDARYYHPIIYTDSDEHTCLREPLALETKQHRIHINKFQPEAEGGELRFTSDWITLTEAEPVKKLSCVLKPRE